MVSIVVERQSARKENVPEKMNPTRRVHDCFKWTHYHVVFDGGPFIWNWCIRKMPGIQWRAISQRWGRCHGKKRMHHCHGASQAATAAVFDPLASIFITATNTLLLFTLCFHVCRPCVSLSNSMVYPLDRNWAKTLSLTRTLLVRVRTIGGADRPNGLLTWSLFAYR